MTSYGRYRLLENIGRGRLFDVFLAKSFGVEGFEKTLIVKRVHDDLCGQPGFVDTFIEPAKLSVRLSHANVVQVIDLGRVEEPGRTSYYLATELVRGLTLAEFLSRVRASGHALELPVVLFVMIEAAKALDHAHRRRDEQLKPLGIVHGELTAHNVMLSWEGEVKVSDFNLWRSAERARRMYESQAIDISCLPPERIVGQPAEPAGDLFSLGALGYALLSRSPLERAERNISEGTRSFQVISPELSQEVADILGRLVVSDPDLRPGSAADVHEQLLMAAYSAKLRPTADELSEALQLYKNRDSDEPESGDRMARSVPSLVPSGEALMSAPPPPRLELEQDIAVLCFRLGSGASPALARASRLVEHFGGRIIAPVEHKLVAVFGLDQADHRDPETAVRCGLLISDILSVADEGGAVGVEAGKVAQPTSDLSVLWDALIVQRASRLSDAESGRVAVSVAVSRALHGRFELEASNLGSEAMLVGRARRLEDAHGRFVGRRRELAVLGRQLSSAARSGPIITAVVGPPGVGKSRLVHELERRIRKSGYRFRCHRIGCRTHTWMRSRGVLKTLLCQLLGISALRALPRVSGVEQRLRASGLTDREFAAVSNELGLETESSKQIRVTPRLLAQALRRILHALCAEAPLVLTFDDVQDMDRQSAEILSDALGMLDAARLLVVLTARPEGVGTCEVLGAPAPLPLGPLEEEAIERFLGTRLNVEKVDADLCDFVKTRTSRHPLYMTELLRAAIESGAVRISGAGVQYRVDALAVARPLKALINDRMARLGENERRLLLAVTVTRDASLVLASVMADMPVGRVLSLAERLELHGVLQRSGSAGLELATPLIEEVLLDSLEPDELAAWHRLAARSLEQLGGNDAAEWPRIGYHYERASDSQRAAEYFARSGLDAARRQHRLETARYLVVALRVADLARTDEMEMAEWLTRLAAVADEATRCRELGEVLQRVGVYLVAVEGELSRAGVACRFALARLNAALHRYRDARKLLEVAGPAARKWPALHQEMMLLQAEIMIELGEFSAASEVLGAARRQEPGDEHLQHRLLLATAQALGGAGEHGRALEVLERAQSLADPAEPQRSYQMAQTRALILGYRGDWQGAVEASNRAAELARDSGQLYQEVRSLVFEGAALLRLDKLARAFAVLQAAHERASETGSARLLNSAGLMLAYLDGINGVQGAETELGRYLAYAEKRRWNPDVIFGRCLLGKLLVHRSQITQGKRELELAHRLAQAIEHQWLIDDCERALEQAQRQKSR